VYILLEYANLAIAIANILIVNYLMNFRFLAYGPRLLNYYLLTTAEKSVTYNPAEFDFPILAKYTGVKGNIIEVN
jgi:hypothetical protein